MAKLNRIGLDISKSQKLIKRLNDLLSNYQLFYQNARGFHWNIRGENFFELHLKFEELYTDALLKIDDYYGMTGQHRDVSLLALMDNIACEEGIEFEPAKLSIQLSDAQLG